MKIYTWTNFTKRRNSTAIPASPGTEIEVTLKENTSVENPTFVLSSAGLAFSVNYIKAFSNHYYFVTDIVSVRNNLIEVKCEMDVLATFKTDISAYTAYIERSASFYDTDYPDPMVSIQNDIVHSEASKTTNMFISGGTAGCYVLSVLNNLGSGTGFTTSYILSVSDLEQIAQYVNTDWGSAISGVTTVIEWLQATFLKTADCIIDCIWLPIASSFYEQSSLVSHEIVKIGVDNVTVGGVDVYGYRFLSPLIVGDSVDITIPHYHSDFRKYAPYTQATLYLPGYGNVNINTIDFKKNDKIKLAWRVDMATGDCCCAVGNNDGKLVSFYTYNVGVSCPVGKVSSNVTGFLSNAFSTAAMVANARVLPEKFQLSAGLSAAASGVNALSALTGITPSVSGGKGGRAIFRDADVYVNTFARITSDPADLLLEHGRVCMSAHQLGLCSGYVKCTNADIPIAGFGLEKEELNNYLNNGFYFE